MAQSAMERTESRGAHQRTVAQPTGDKFLAHSLAYRDAAGRRSVYSRHHHALASAERVYGREPRNGSRITIESHATIPRVIQARHDFV